MATPLPLDRILGHPPTQPALWRVDGPPATYGELSEGAGHVARRLQNGRQTLGGARVALLLPPGAAFVQALLGTWRAGGTAVPLSSLHTAPELAHMLATATPEVLIADPALALTLDQLMATPNAPPLARRLTMTELVAAGADKPPPRDAGDMTSEGDALILFTSGTTGRPKGVRLSHAGVAATLDSLATAWSWRQDDRLLHALPLYHTHGLIVALLGALWAGAAVRFISFDAAPVWDAFEWASVFMAVPTMYVRLVDAYQTAAPARQARWRAGARALRLFTSGSAALPATLLTAFQEATGQTILERYGMTEIGMALSNPYQGPRRAGSVGLPLPGVEVEIVGDDGLPVPDGESGELRVRSPQLFLGYHGDAASTAASYDGLGRFRTGDTGVRSPDDGFVRLLGRTSVDILKSGGYKLSALEIEDALRSHPAVAEVAVIGVPDPLWGDCVTACVVPRAGAQVSLEELRFFARQVLAPYKLPRALRLMSALPRGPMGKVQKSLLK